MRKNLDKLSGFDTRTQTTGMQMKTRTMTKLFAAAAAAGLALGLHAETALTFAPLAANRQTQDYVATDVTLPGDGDFTWEAWVKPSDVSLAENRLLGQTDWTSEGRLILELRKAGETDNVTKLAAFYRAGGANKRAVAGTTVFAADVWHHVALTRSGTAFVKGRDAFMKRIAYCAAAQVLRRRSYRRNLVWIDSIPICDAPLDEAALTLAWDCGEWVASGRDGATVQSLNHRMTELPNYQEAEIVVDVRRHKANPEALYDATWNLLRVTRRGIDDPQERVSVRTKNASTLILIK